MPSGNYPDFYDTTNDYRTWTNTITVTYLSKSQEQPPPSGVTVTNVLWTEIRKGNLPSDSFLLAFDRTFRLAMAKMQGIVPKEKDIIVDDQGIRWVIGPFNKGSVEILSFGNEYRVHCTKSMKQNSSPAT